MELVFPDGNVRSSGTPEAALPRVTAHRLPCGIDARGPAAKTASYLGELGDRIHFRGRELRRGTVPLPSDTTGS
jgi:hypothetical protein